MASPQLRADCPECRSAGTMAGSRCQICDAETTGESTPSPPGASGRAHRDGAVDLPPTAPAPPPIRFSEVVAELRGISALLRRDPSPSLVQEACRRVEAMLNAIRAQFISDVVVGRPAPAASRSAP